MSVRRRRQGCGNCHTEKVDTIAAGHVTNVDPEAEDYRKFTDSCEDISETTTCAVCGDVAVKHNFNSELTKVDASCFENGYTVKICANCEATDVTILPKIGHHSVYFDEENDTWVIPADAVKLTDKCVAPTHTDAGKDVYECAVCDAEIEVPVAKLTGIELNVSVDNGLVAGANIVTGGYVTFTVKFNASDVDATSLVAKLAFNKDYLIYDSIVVEDIFASFDEEGNPVSVTNVGEVWAENGVLTFMVDASNDTTGAPVDVNFNGEYTLAKVTFRVNPALVDEFVDFATALEEEVTATADFYNTDAETLVAAADTCDYAVNCIGNVNGDTAINAIDALVIRMIIGGTYEIDDEIVDYVAELDFDMDGEITALDYAAIQRYIIGRYDAEELSSLVALPEVDA